MNNPRFDIVLFGATSFVGKILCRYLVEIGAQSGELHWAAAGRSAGKLKSLKESLGPGARDLSLIVADAHDAVALIELCKQAHLVLSTVGPYELYGDTLVQVCAETGTDYCDLTGEVRWMRRMIDSHQDAAQRSGARIVHACGFDCVPSDMGVWFLQQQSMRLHGEYCNRIEMRLMAASGAFSGGTVATMLNEAAALERDPQLFRPLRNPYFLCPEGYRNETRQRRITAAEYDAEIGKWIMPNVMATVEEPVVFRSHALAGNPYGEAFLYNEAVAAGRGRKGQLKARGMTGLGKLFFLGLSKTGTRRILQRWVLPAPGEGPDEQARERGFYVIAFSGHTASGKKVQARVTGDRDPGYGSTAKILAQCGISLLRDVPANHPGGFWTTATIFDARLLDGLREWAVVSFDLIAD